MAESAASPSLSHEASSCAITVHIGFESFCYLPCLHGPISIDIACIPDAISIAAHKPLGSKYFRATRLARTALDQRGQTSEVCTPRRSSVT